MLQEVFLNISRYPHNFVADRADSFNRWSCRIVRNTALKHLRKDSRQPRPLDLDPDELSITIEDPHAVQPEHAAIHRESAASVDFAYVLYLTLYQACYRRLSRQDQRLLTAVEIDGRRYGELAAETGVSANAIKVRVYRARRRISLGIAEVLMDAGSTSADCRR